MSASNLERERLETSSMSRRTTASAGQDVPSSGANAAAVLLQNWLDARRGGVR